MRRSRSIDSRRMNDYEALNNNQEKRPESHDNKQPNQQEHRTNEESHNLPGRGPVSYTHLDVYKRQ